jgi:hypothetical protein
LDSWATRTRILATGSDRLLWHCWKSMDVLKVEDVARLLQVNKKWVYAHAIELGGFRLGDRMLRFPREKVEEYLVQQAQRETKPRVVEQVERPREYRVSL